jgi:hypothetical protein
MARSAAVAKRRVKKRDETEVMLPPHLTTDTNSRGILEYQRPEKIDHEGREMNKTIKKKGT